MKTTEQIVIVQSRKNPSITRRMTLSSAKMNNAKWKTLVIDHESPKIDGKINICVCTAVWKRPEVFKLFAKGIKAIKSEDVNITVIVAGSEGEKSRNLVESEGFVYIETPNDPLARKHNEAVKVARQHSPNYVLLTGSDDILSPEAFQVYIQQMRNGIDYIGVTDFYFWDSVQKKASYWGGYIDKNRKGHTCGAFRCYSARLMSIWDWQPFDVKHSHVLDNSTQIKLRQIRHTQYIFSLKQKGVFAVDIKSDTNMTPFKLWPNTQYISNNVIINKFPYLKQNSNG